MENTAKQFFDPFEVHEKLKRNMIMYLDADPENIDQTPLDQRLDKELKTIKPTLMGPRDG